MFIGVVFLRHFLRPWFIGQKRFRALETVSNAVELSEALCHSVDMEKNEKVELTFVWEKKKGEPFL